MRFHLGERKGHDQVLIFLRSPAFPLAAENGTKAMRFISRPRATACFSSTFSTPALATLATWKAARHVGCRTFQAPNRAVKSNLHLKPFAPISQVMQQLSAVSENLAKKGPMAQARWVHRKTRVHLFPSPCHYFSGLQPLSPPSIFT